jgi:hypothetical protein
MCFFLPGNHLNCKTNFPSGGQFFACGKLVIKLWECYQIFSYVWDKIFPEKYGSGIIKVKPGRSTPVNKNAWEGAFLGRATRSRIFSRP